MQGGNRKGEIFETKVRQNLANRILKYILKLNYSRIHAINALIAIMQLHDKADFTDLVLRDQISKILFVVLPTIAAVLIKACVEETLKGSSLVVTATRAIGRYLCLVFEDYEKQTEENIHNDDFLRLLNTLANNDERFDVLLQKNKSKTDFVVNSKKSDEWLRAASKKLASAIVRLKTLRGSEHREVRNELAILSHSLLHKCFTNIRSFAPFLLENLLTLADDNDESIRLFSQASLDKLSSIVNHEISELFDSHLATMPRIILTGHDSEQIAGFTLLNSVVVTLSSNPDLAPLLHNPVSLEKFLNILLSCCEIDVPDDLMFYENLSPGTLDDQFYKMKRPWKKFKNLKTESVERKFKQICHNIGSLEAAQPCINFLLDNMNSIEYLVLLVEFMSCGADTALAQDQIENIVEEFLVESYWAMPIRATEQVERKQRNVHEQWFSENTPGLYESAVEVRLRDITLDDESDKFKQNFCLQTIKYNILCTCLVLELTGTAASLLQSNFQKFMLRTLHRVLEKAGSSNFIIRTAGLSALDSIAAATISKDVSQLIDNNADFLLFNIRKLLKRNQDNDAVLDMLSVVFKLSKTSMTSYIKDIVETVAEQMTSARHANNTSCYLKLFRLYAVSIKQWEKISDGEDDVEIHSSWEDFYDQCLHELVTEPENVYDSCPLNESFHEDIEPPPKELQDDDNILPEYIELLNKILTSTLQFFASTNPFEVITTHEIFLESLPVLHRYDDHFLQIVHQMWYPFTKQFQVKNLVVLQYSFRLLVLVVRLAKDFVYKTTTKDVIPVINKFLTQTMKSNLPAANLSYTQEFKLQREILGSYGKIAVDLDLQDKDLDVIVDILLKYEQHSNEILAGASKQSLNILKSYNPGLILFKMKL